MFQQMFLKIELFYKLKRMFGMSYPKKMFGTISVQTLFKARKKNIYDLVTERLAQSLGYLTKKNIYSLCF